MTGSRFYMKGRLLLLFAVCSRFGIAAEFVVNTNHCLDEEDSSSWGDGVCDATLFDYTTGRYVKTGKCSLTAALRETATLAGHDTITFSVSTLDHC